MTNTPRSEEKKCENLVHAVQLRSPYATPQDHTCIECGEVVHLEVQVYPRWLTEALQDFVLDADGKPAINYQTGRPMTVFGIGYAEDRRGRNWERLQPHYRAHHPDFQDGMQPDERDTEEA